MWKIAFNRGFLRLVVLDSFVFTTHSIVNMKCPVHVLEQVVPLVVSHLHHGGDQSRVWEGVLFFIS